MYIRGKKLFIKCVLNCRLYSEVKGVKTLRTTELNKHSGMQPPVDPVNMQTKSNVHRPRIQEKRMYINMQFSQISKE